MLNGWIMLHRKMLDNWVSQEPELLSVWVRLLLEANHSDTKKMFNGSLVIIKRGQLIFGLNAFSLKSKVSESKIRRYMILLEKDGMINRLKTNKYSIISIVNFESHQADRRLDAGKQQADDSQTAGKQQHLNNGNNGENDNKQDQSPEILKDCHSEEDLQSAFDIFYKSGLTKKSKAQALKKFKSLVKEMKADPFEFTELLSKDIKHRIAKGQYGIDKLHPSTYLNNQRWEDEYEQNNGQPQVAGKQSAAERIAERNRQRYGEQGGGLGMGEDGRDLRGTMDQGAGRESFTTLEGSFEQIEPGAGKNRGGQGGY